MNQSSRFDPEFEEVYAAIACAIRNDRDRPAGLLASGLVFRSRMTKACVAAVHRKMLTGEPLEGDQEEDIADRLRRQLVASE